MIEFVSIRFFIFGFCFVRIFTFVTLALSIFDGIQDSLSPLNMAMIMVTGFLKVRALARKAEGARVVVISSLRVAIRGMVAVPLSRAMIMR